MTIPNSITSIAEYAFYLCSGLKSLTIPNSVTSIGEYAFAYCEALTSVAIPNSVTSIGENTFNECKGLTSVTIPNSITYIGEYAFYSCSGLKSLTIPNSVTSIGKHAFSYCCDLTEVILPPSVETIGESAFAQNTNLKSIIMEYNVTTIGDNAFSGCPVQTFCITAQTPPDAPIGTFSDYTGELYVQGQTAANAYCDADPCWSQFESHLMIEPTEFKIEGNKTITGKPGDTFQLSARLMPENVTLPHIFWHSTNPDIATVNENGLVTLHTDSGDIMTLAESDNGAEDCKIIAETLYAAGPIAEISVSNKTMGINDIISDNESSGDIDFSAPVEVYNLQGIRIACSTDILEKGFYIVRQGKNVKKILIN